MRGAGSHRGRIGLPTPLGHETRRNRKFAGRDGRIHSAGDLSSYCRCSRLIHEAIVRAADNAVLPGFYESVSARIADHRSLPGEVLDIITPLLNAPVFGDGGHFREVALS